MNWKRKEPYHAVIHEFHLLQHVVDKGTSVQFLQAPLNNVHFRNLLCREEGLLEAQGIQHSIDCTEPPQNLLSLWSWRQQLSWSYSSLYMHPWGFWLQICGVVVAIVSTCIAGGAPASFSSRCSCQSLASTSRRNYVRKLTCNCSPWSDKGDTKEHLSQEKKMVCLRMKKKYIVKILNAYIIKNMCFFSRSRSSSLEICCWIERSLLQVLTCGWLTVLMYQSLFLS